MTKVKFSKKEESGAAFVDKRRAALERSVIGGCEKPVVEHAVWFWVCFGSFYMYCCAVVECFCSVFQTNGSVLLFVVCL